ncbi:hypothetical protein VIGAN_01172400 [Vigna angularis var. angularis]|uniref:Uncharacterized protein n=1 Tax=Vigna angularis var. angularis TaxID=157739 RepID=A0A0S3R0J8_PHAAN|nr:hypothetical protein VIGAN_01172400 [Vigna angularis var. angularis]
MGNPNPLPQRNASSSGVSPSRELSFKNYNKEGNQNFKDSQIKSDSCSCVLRRNKSGKVVFNGGAGQIFENSIINGVKVKSETTSSSESKTTGGEIYCTTCRSFMNLGTGSQNFQGFVLNNGSN